MEVGPLQEVSLQPRILPNTQTSHSLSTQDLAPMEIGPTHVVLLATMSFVEFKNLRHMGAVERSICIEIPSQKVDQNQLLAADKVLF